MNRVTYVAVVLLLLVTGASAGTFTSPYGTVTTTSSTIDFLAASGYSLKIQDGNDFNINCGGCSISITSLSLDYVNSLGQTVTIDDVPYTLTNGNTVGSGLGVFDYNFTKIATGDPRFTGITSVDSLHITYTGTATFTDFAFHICAAGGTNCSPNTFFADTNGNTSQVPEPTTLALFGTGLVGLASRLRKRRIS